MATNNPFEDTQSNNDSGGWSLAAGFFVLVLVLFIFLELESGIIPRGTEPIILGLLFIVLPLLLGLINAVQGYTYSSSLAIGVSPMVAWLILTIGKVFIGSVRTELIVLFGYAIVIALGGALAALGGFAIGYLGRIATAKYAK
jgi:hypothetical protein